MSAQPIPSTTEDRAGSVSAPRQSARRRDARRPRGAGTWAAYRWELIKLAALVRTRAMLIGVLVAPPLVVLALQGQRAPADTLFGRHVHDSGFALPLLLLGFATQYVFPLLTSVVVHDLPENRGVNFGQINHQNVWKYEYGARNELSYRLHHESPFAAAGFAVRVLRDMAQGHVSRSLRLRIVKALARGVKFDPKPKFPRSVL